jgi:chromosome segregation protein
MRLTKIKLAGFKSFVDPTSFHVPGQLVGIVGPNGCGKSNLIDAVRWVMGESSAKQLRGDSMADVIFNGSSSRKPVGQAAIELFFDNSDGRLGGEYAGYRELAVRRVVSRDGQSNYYLNGSRCRRRDITDVFLGTGLGPRSYAIIEQGTISRVVEASPEQLRGFLEEAAGISRYKERRRETENRIRHARENLDRVSDIREELAKQLEKLQRQAKNAVRFRELKTNERQLKGCLLALRWREMARQVEALESEGQEITLALEAALGRQRATEAKLTRSREALHDANVALNDSQACFYTAGAEVAKVEQGIRHAREVRGQRRDDLSRSRQALADADHHLEQDQCQESGLLDFLHEAEPRWQSAREAETATAGCLHEAELGRDASRERADELSRRYADVGRGVEVERTRIDHLERQLARLDERGKQLTAQDRELSGARADPEELGLDQALASADLEVARLDATLASLALRIEEQRGEEQALVADVGSQRGALQLDRGRLTSLETLQEAALSGDGAEPEAWLRANGLGDTPRLADAIRVRVGWEAAVEAALGRRVAAHCVAELDGPARGIASLHEGRISLYDTTVEPVPAENGDFASPLNAVVEAPWPLQGLLAHIFCADSIQAALATRGALSPHQALVTPDGTLVGRDWLQSERGSDPQAGVLARSREMDATRAQIAEQEHRLARTEASLTACRQALGDADVARNGLQAESTAAHRRQAELRAQLAARDRRLQEIQRRGERLREETRELSAQREAEYQELRLARERLQEGLEALDIANQAREVALATRDEDEKQLRSAQERARDASAHAARLALEVESRRSTLGSLRQGLERQSAQRRDLSQRVLDLEQALADCESPIPALEAELGQALKARGSAEGALARARDELAGCESTLRDLDSQRQTDEQRSVSVRERLESTRMAAGEARARRDAVAEQLKELGLGREESLAAIPEAADEGSLQAELERLQRSIERLGPINLAAIDEFERESERKHYLDSQHQDLSDALGMLEEAIRRIDRETRQRFKATFDQVNAGIGELFPRLFGGGSAFLELLGDDPLDAGVAVMARPPGKRISNIHLLSGGEKALTAVALVFTIFRLNPSPFCMLDEVDAPLDEANVGRYCELVKEMSEQVQFIVITHNRTTMEALDQLVGVTMHEPGCSRLVSVDVAQATRLAAV